VGDDMVGALLRASVRDAPPLVLHRIHPGARRGCHAVRPRSPGEGDAAATPTRTLAVPCVVRRRPLAVPHERPFFLDARRRPFGYLALQHSCRRARAPVSRPAMCDHLVQLAAGERGQQLVVRLERTRDEREQLVREVVESHGRRALGSGARVAPRRPDRRVGERVDARVSRTAASLLRSQRAEQHAHIGQQAQRLRTRERRHHLGMRDASCCGTRAARADRRVGERVDARVSRPHL
jgi:hypothetical protein